MKGIFHIRERFRKIFVNTRRFNIVFFLNNILNVPRCLDLIHDKFLSHLSGFPIIVVFSREISN